MRPARKTLLLVVTATACTVLGGICTHLLSSALEKRFGTPVLHSWVALALILAILVSCGILIRRRQLAAGDEGEGRFRGRQSLRDSLQDRVRHYWIEGLLDRSLYNIARLELGLVDRPDRIVSCLTLMVQEMQREASRLPSGIRMLDIFDRCCGALLILGAPGSGKTTLLLELARDLQQPEGRWSAFIPVVFNLSSWASNRTTLSNWLAEELNRIYGVSPVEAQRLIQREQVLPMLDGLDEVPAELRSECVGVINEFREQFGLLPLAVCCRIQDYDVLPARLKLLGAVALEPLSAADVRNYLDYVRDDRLDGLRTALVQDSTLWGILDSPLMLTVAMLAYSTPMHETSRRSRRLDRRRQLFELYVQKMFTRRTVALAYPRERTIQWMRHLALGMERQKRSMFHLEVLDTCWVGSPLCRLLTASAVFAPVWILATLIASVAVWLQYSWLLGPAVGLGFALYFGAAIGLFVGLYAGIGVAGAELGDGIEWSWHSSDESQRKSLDSPKDFWPPLQCGCLIIIALLLLAVLNMIVGSFALALLGTIIVGVGVAALVEVARGLRPRAISHTVEPNQGTWRSATSALVVALALGLAAGVMGSTVFGLLARPGERARVALAVGTVFGVGCSVIVGLTQGLLVFFRHWVTRIVLWICGDAPLRYIRFLDFAAERLFLRKIGGGYVFIHRMLLDYFVSSSRWRRKAPVGSARSRKLAAATNALGRTVVAGVMIAACIVGVLTIGFEELKREAVRDAIIEADAIVFADTGESKHGFSRSLNQQIQRFLDLPSSRANPYVIVFGDVTPEILSLARLDLRTSGRIIVRPTQRSEYSTIVVAREILNSEGLTKCVWVSDGYRMFRTRRILERSGIKVYRAPLSDSIALDLHGWNQCASEVPLLLLWLLGVGT